MSKFTILVYVETEKSTGLIASRDEQVDAIVDELTSAIEGFEISNIGARSDSEYSVTSVDTWIMDKRDEKEMHAEYERQVRAEEPTDRTLRNEIRAARDEAAKFKSLYETQKAIVDQIIEGDPLADSNIYQEPRAWTDNAEPRKNLDPRERVFFQWGDHRSDRLSVQWSNYDDGSIEISADTIGREFAVLPQSGNVVRIKVI